MNKIREKQTPTTLPQSTVRKELHDELKTHPGYLFSIFEPFVFKAKSFLSD